MLSVSLADLQNFVHDYIKQRFRLIFKEGTESNTCITRNRTQDMVYIPSSSNAHKKLQARETTHLYSLKRSEISSLTFLIYTKEKLYVTGEQ